MAMTTTKATLCDNATAKKTVREKSEKFIVQILSTVAAAAAGLRGLPGLLGLSVKPREDTESERGLIPDIERIVCQS